MTAAAEVEAGTGRGASKAPKATNLRRGKWTTEEEAYANRLIADFKNGLLPLTEGTTLRSFLSKLLNCDPMRISKKFVGTNCIGKQVNEAHKHRFSRRERETPLCQLSDALDSVSSAPAVQ